MIKAYSKTLNLNAALDIFQKMLDDSYNPNNKYQI